MGLIGLALLGFFLLPGQRSQETARSEKRQPTGVANGSLASQGSGITAEYQPLLSPPSLPSSSNGVAVEGSAPGDTAAAAGPAVTEPQAALPSSGDAAPRAQLEGIAAIAAELAALNPLVAGQPGVGQPTEGVASQLVDLPEIKLDLSGIQPAMSALSQIVAQAQANATATALQAQTGVIPHEPGGGGAEPRVP